MAGTTSKTAASKAAPKKAVAEKPVVAPPPVKAAPAVKADTKAAESKPVAAKKPIAAKPAETKPVAEKKPAAVKKPTAAKPAKVEKPVAEVVSVTVLAVSDEQRYRMVAEAAYYRAESNHFKSDPLRDWIEAEQDIAALLNGKK